MGHQIRTFTYEGSREQPAGQEINFSDGAWLIVNWCGKAYEKKNGELQPMTHEEAEAMAGSTFIGAPAVIETDAQVPLTFEEAARAGWLEGKYRRPIDTETFERCRAFLRLAADGGYHISGSY